MPPRLNKRQLREQEELFALRPTKEESDSDEEEVPSGVEKSMMVRSAQVIVTIWKLNHIESSARWRSMIWKKMTQRTDPQSLRKCVHPP